MEIPYTHNHHDNDGDYSFRVAIEQMSSEIVESGDDLYTWLDFQSSSMGDYGIFSDKFDTYLQDHPTEELQSFEAANVKYGFLTGLLIARRSIGNNADMALFPHIEALLNPQAMKDYTPEEFISDGYGSYEEYISSTFDTLDMQQNPLAALAEQITTGMNLSQRDSGYFYSGLGMSLDVYATWRSETREYTPPAELARIPSNTERNLFDIDTAHNELMATIERVPSGSAIIDLYANRYNRTASYKKLFTIGNTVSYSHNNNIYNEYTSYQRDNYRKGTLIGLSVAEKLLGKPFDDELLGAIDTIYTTTPETHADKRAFIDENYFQDCLAVYHNDILYDPYYDTQPNPFIEYAEYAKQQLGIPSQYTEYYAAGFGAVIWAIGEAQKSLYEKLDHVDTNAQ